VRVRRSRPSDRSSTVESKRFHHGRRVAVGEQGSAKTVLSKMLKALVDPNAGPAQALPANATGAGLFRSRRATTQPRLTF
jgi:hypothetical protein